MFGYYIAGFWFCYVEDYLWLCFGVVFLEVVVDDL